MYNEVEINKLISLIQRYDGIGDKEKLSRIVQGEFGLIKDRRVFSDATADFAIRFSMSKRKKWAIRFFHSRHCRSTIAGHFLCA